MKLSVSPATRLMLGLLVLAAAAVWLWTETAQGPPITGGAGPEVVLAEPEPIGAAAYDEKLSELAGQRLEGPQLESAARRAMEAYEARLDALAGQIAGDADGNPDDDADWRDVFKQLEKDHPPDAAAVLEAYRSEIARQELFLAPLALFPAPPAPARVVVNENPIFRRYFSLAMYLDGQLAVTLEASGATGSATGGTTGGAPADAGSYLVNHCRACIPPLVAHEVAPGHHVAYSVAATAISDAGELLFANRSHVVYHEGWGLYAEQLMLELGYYEDPALELGAVRLLYLRALRAAIDPALHRGEIGRDEAIELYRTRGNLGTAAAAVEVARHLKDPGLKASYFIGLRQISTLRRLVVGEDPSPAELGAFHARLLGRPRPISEIARDVFGVELPPWTSLGSSPG